MKLKNSFKGFTLVEVLIVIIIVGILIAALLPRLQGTQARARNTARTGGLTQLAQAVALYSADNPSSTLTGGCASVSSTELDPYLSSMPTDPQGSGGPNCSDGTYNIAFTGGNYVLSASLEGTGNGNCSGTGSAAALSVGGDTYCVIVQ